MKKYFLFFAITATLLFASCSVDQQNGNAVINSYDFSVSQNQWFSVGKLGEAGYGWAVDLNFPELTNNVVYNGMVSLYIKSGDTWTPVPVNIFNKGYQSGYIYAIKPGVLSIEFYESDQQTVNPGAQTFRLAVVQPI